MIGWLKNRAWPAVETLAERWDLDEGFVRSAAMAYYAAFSLFPLMLVLLSAFGAASRFSTALQIGQQDLLQAVQQSAGPWIASRLGELLVNVKAQANIGGPIGFLGLILAALGMFAQLDHLLDRIWKTRSQRPGGFVGTLKNAFIDRLTAFVMLLFLGGLLTVVWVVQVFLSAFQAHADGLRFSGYAFDGLHALLAPLVYGLALTTIYKVLPRAAVTWREAAAGGVLVAVAWSVGQRILEWFVIGDSYSAYGLVGAFMGVMAWLYYASAALFFGAEFVQMICGRCPKK